MADNTVLVNMKVVSDISDVVSNVGAIQKSFSKLKLPEKLGEGLNKNITEFYKEYDKYQKKIAEGLKTQGDYNQVEKSLNRMKSLYETIGKEASKVTKLDLESLLDLGSGDFKQIADEIANTIKQINQVKIDPSAITKQMNALRNSLKGDKFSKKGGLLDQLIGNVKTGKLVEAKKVFKELQIEVQKIMPKTDANGDFIARMVGKLNPTNALAVTNALKEMGAVFSATDNEIDPLNRKLDELQTELQETKNKATGKILGDTNDFNEYGKNVESVTDSLKRMHQEEFSFNRQAQDIDRQIQSYFGLSQMIRKVGDIARDAFATVKELDAAMTQTAVVTNFSVGDMWDMLPTYTAQANQLGSTIKDVYEAATLYYQQGLNTNQAMGLANETLKMARIAGLDAADATNMMTAALRGFNMEINQMSAQKVNDIYSELAAITASDTAEIGSAMERTASIANSANMEFATTSAFLAQMIETTREAPENLGTAMKTIIARFQEMKQDPTKLVDSEGVAMDANKVDKALKTIGVQLMNTKGEFRDLDDVFLDIASKWDSLSQGQQRYIATIAAGSRQQSRFIAMMSDYERTMELVDAANNSAGASQRQFEKTLDSMEAKLNKLKNAWEQFTMGLMNNQILKFGVDALTKGFTIINKFIDILGRIPPKPFEGITKSVLTLVTTLGMLQLGKRGSRGLVQGAFGWWKEGKSFTKSFAEGWAGPEGTKAVVKDSKYGDAIRASIISAKIPQTIQGEFVKGEALASAAFNTGTKLVALSNIIDESELDAEAKALGQRIRKEIEAEIEAGTLKPELAINKFNQRFSEESGSTAFTVAPRQVEEEAQKVAQLGNEFTGLGAKVTKAGATLQLFGSNIKGPVGNALVHIGNLLVTTGDFAISAAKKFKEAFVAAQAAKAAGANTGGVIKAFIGVFTKIPPHILAIIAAVAVAAGVIYRFATENKRALESATDAAAKASEAYDSAKQETSELADAIEQVKANEDAFDGLVAGTAEFNEQLVTANEQIMALIDKYPMLNDSKYLSTDKNGLMHINQAGLDAVRDYQKQIQANASAMNLIQTADLNEVENQQKADNLRKVKGAMTQEEHEKNMRDADLLEQRIKAETELARQNAIRVSLADKEIHNAETMSKIMADQYETKRESAKLDVESMNKHERRQAYADFHGYTYNKSTKKITDVEGNEIDYDDKAIKDEVIEQQVILEFQEDAESLERALASVNSKFASGLEEQTAGSAHVISDILSSNIETDEEILRKVLSEPNQLQDLVDNLSETEMAAILGISASSITDTNINKYKQDIVNKLTDKAENIAEAQAESYAELGAMMAKAQGNILDKNGKLLGQQGKTSKEIEQSIAEQIDNLKPEYAHLMSSVGSKLQEFAGEDTMSTFINQAYDIYSENAGKTVNELNKLIDNTNFDSAISRLTFYNKAMQSSNTRIQEIGKSMKNTTGEANLLGQAFDEFLGSSDWAELSENADDFKNALGEYDAAGIQKAAEQSRTLNELLNSGAISAGGVAAALQGMDDGTITNLNSTVLALLSSFNKLADVASEAHKIIEGFDPGIDTGEGEDFIKENAEKFKEYYDNGEFGNEQLQNYIKLAAGTDKWNKALRENGGDLREAAKDLKHYVTAFDEGFVPVYDKLTQGLDLQGNKISDDVKKEFEGLEFLWDENDELQINLADFGTDDLQAYLQKALGISEEYAKLMLQNLSNYDTQLSSQLRANDIKKSLGDKDFQAAHQDSQGKFILSDSDIRAVGASLELETDINTPEGFEEATKALEKLAGVELKVFRTQNDDGSQREDYDNLLADYTETFYGQKVEDLFGVQELQQGGKFDVGKLVNDSIAKGMDSNQASQVAYEAIQKANAEGITDLLYNGQLLDLSQITSYEDFLAATQKLTDSAQWYEVGQSIAEGIISYIEGKDNNSEQTNQTPASTDSNNNKPKRTEAKPPGMSSSDWDKYQNGGAATSTAKWENYVPGWLAPIIKAVKTESDARTEQNAEANGPTAEEVRARNKQWWSDFFSEGEHAAEARGQKTSGGQETPQQPTKQSSSTEVSEASTELITSAQSLTTVSEALNTSATNLTTAGETLQTAGENLTSAAAIIVANGQGGNSGGPFGGGNTNGVPVPQTKESSVSGVIVVDNAAALKSLDEVITKAEEAKSTIDDGATFKVNVTGTKKLQNAAKDAANLTSKNGSSASIAVSTGAVNKDSVKEGISEINRSRATIIVDANTQPAILKARNAANIMDSYHAVIDVEARVKKTGISSITVEGKTVNITARASGVNNHGYAPAPHAGSVARGSYGRVGPKGKGGLTLTGELGYEIAWLPSENRSMILGANGPQMVDLPGDAVVWTHEQSKKILKQKAIPAGSHGNTSLKKPSSSGGGGGSYHKTGNNNNNNNKTPNTPKKDNSKKTDTIIQKAGKVVVWWDNYSRKLETLTRKADKQLKKSDNLLKQVGMTITKFNKNSNVKGYRESLQRTITLNKTAEKRAKGELNSLRTGRKYKGKRYSRQEISYEVTKKDKKGKKTKETINKTIDVSKYIKKVGDDYIIDQKAINKVANKNKSKAESIVSVVNRELNEKISNRNKAQDEIAKAKEAFEELANKVYEAFGGWEKSITHVYVLSKRLEELSTRKNLYDTQAEHEYTRLRAGFGAVNSSSVKRITGLLQKAADTMVKQVKTNAANVSATSKEYTDSLSRQFYYSSYMNLKKQGGNGTDTKNDWKTAKMGLAFLDSIGFNEKNFNYNTAVTKLLEKGYTNDTYDKIKEFLDRIYEKQINYEQAIIDAYGSMDEIYNTIIEYRDFISDFEGEVLAGLEEQTEKEIEHLDKLNSSLTAAYKDLLDEVKNSLDARRKKEDNEKTESDLSKRMQRLALLRADTSGGHAVEIAQLEQEIADAQKDYQRSLEDQLIENLQNQADKAEKQRERQIELLQVQADLAKGTGENLALVTQWLTNPTANEGKIKKAWLDNQGYNEMTPDNQKKLLDDWNATWAQFLATRNALPILEKAAKGLETKSLGKNDTLEGYQGNVLSYLNTMSNNIDRLVNYNKTTKAAEYKKAGASVKEAIKESKARGDTLSYSELKAGGYTAADFKKDNIPVKRLKKIFGLKQLAKGGYTYAELRSIGYEDKDFKSKINAATARAIGMPPKTIAKLYGGSKALRKGNVGGAVVQKTNKFSATKIQKTINKNKKDAATQSDMAGVTTKMDINGKKKGGSKTGTISTSGKKIATNKGSRLYIQDWDKKKARAAGKSTQKVYKAKELTAAIFKANKDQATDALIYAIKHTEPGKVINANSATLFKLAKLQGKTYKLQNGITGSVGKNGIIYYNDGKKGVNKWDTAKGEIELDKYTKKDKKRFQKLAKSNKTIGREYAQVLKKRGITYATGGLADYTGPAWLDGTPSKPELVLNAQDTKNFIALKDVLNKAIGSTGAVENTYGNATYEININVDHLNNDYDVDKVVERVKKKIVQDSSYRNVTQVRKFR